MRADRRAESFWLRSGLALAAVLWAGAVEAQFTNVTATSGAINVGGVGYEGLALGRLERGRRPEPVRVAPVCRSRGRQRQPC